MANFFEHPEGIWWSIWFMIVIKFSSWRGNECQTFEIKGLWWWYLSYKNYGNNDMCLINRATIYTIFLFENKWNKHYSLEKFIEFEYIPK